jgi:hypothetical protein
MKTPLHNRFENPGNKEKLYDFGLTPAGMVGAVVVLMETSMLRPSQRSWPGQ